MIHTCIALQEMSAWLGLALAFSLEAIIRSEVAYGLYAFIIAVADAVEIDFFLLQPTKIII